MSEEKSDCKVELSTEDDGHLFFGCLKLVDVGDAGGDVGDGLTQPFFFKCLRIELGNSIVVSNDGASGASEETHVINVVGFPAGVYGYIGMCLF